MATVSHDELQELKRLYALVERYVSAPNILTKDETEEFFKLSGKWRAVPVIAMLIETVEDLTGELEDLRAIVNLPRGKPSIEVTEFFGGEGSYSVGNGGSGGSCGKTE